MGLIFFLIYVISRKSPELQSLWVDQGIKSQKICIKIDEFEFFFYF